MNDLLIRSAMLEGAPQGEILHVSCHGVHDWTHGPRIGDYIQDALAGSPVAAVVIDLLEYEYVFGNDLAALFVAFYDKSSKTLRPSCIVATGKTRTAIEALFRAGHMLSVVDLTFVSTVEEALGDLRLKLATPPSA